MKGHPMDQIDASSLAHLHTAFIAAREALESAVSAAASRWEEKFLEPEDGGNEAWPPHMAAAHALIGEQWRFRYITELLDQPAAAPAISGEAFAASPAGQQELAERSERYAALSDAAATLTWTANVSPRIDATYARLQEADLARAADLSDDQIAYFESHGQTASRDLRGVLTLAVVHLTDHAQQLRTALA